MRPGALLAALMVALAVAACGKQGRLLPPEGSEFPRTYPAPETMVPQREGEEPQREIEVPEPEEPEEEEPEF